MTRIERAALALVVVAGAAGTLQATVVVPISFEQMARGAHRIFVGEVVSVRSFWEDTKIWTEVRFRVKQSIKGEPAAEVSFRQVGGSVTQPVPVAMRVAGAPEFEAGETDLMFLERAPDGADRVMGLFQGRLKLVRDAASGEWRTADGQPLPDLVARVQAHLRAGASR